MRRSLSALLATFTLVGSGAVSAQATSPAAAQPPARGSFHVRALHPTGFVAHRGSQAAARTSPATGFNNPNCGTCAPPLLFTTATPVGGGLTGTPGHVTITPVYWAPSGFSYSAGYKTVVNGYLANVAAASNTNTNVFAVETQYYQTMSAVTKHIQYVISTTAEIDLTDQFPAQSLSTGCVADSGFSACVADGALQRELQTNLTSLSKPIDDAHIYMVFFPRQTSDGQPVETCQANGSSATQACSTNVYCAYHSGLFVGPGSNQYLLYGNEPWPDLSLCVGNLGPQAPNGDTFGDAEVSPLSHESNETISDWAGAWFDSAGAENGDECAYVYGNNLGSTGVSVPDGLEAGTAYNQTINGAHYYTQDEFSNADFAASQGDVVFQGSATHVFGCLQQDELPSAAFVVPSAVVNVPTGFNGGTSADSDGSIASYSWNWGDSTGNSTGATPTHTFTSTGTFCVTLSVVDVDSWTNSISHPVAVSGGSGTTLPCPPTGINATAGVGSAYLSWSPPAFDGGAAITGYRVTPIRDVTPQNPILTGSNRTNFTVAGLDSTSTYTFTVAAINAIGTGLDSLPSGAVSPIPGGTYAPLVPARILDTRNGIGVPARAAAPLGAGQTLNLQVTGQGLVPSSGVSSVVLNVTVTDTTAGSYLSVWPTGVTQPVVSSLNWVPGKTVANLVEVAVGTITGSVGRVSFFNAAGNTDVIVDVQGWVGDATDSYHRSGLFNPLPPGRDLDTRSGIGAPAAKMGPGAVLNLHVLGVNGVPSSGVSTVVLNVTAVNGSSAGYLTVWPTGSTQPTASSLNFLANQVVPNRVMVGVGSGGDVSIYNPAGYVDVVADVSGWFTDITNTAGGSSFIGEVPTRIYDTRSPGASGPISAGLFLPLSAAPYAIAHVALVLNVTAVNPSQPSYLTVYPDDGNCTAQPPTASDLNFVSGEVVPNMVVAKLGPNAGTCALAFDTYNPAGSVDVVFDENGFYGPIALAPPPWVGAVRVMAGWTPQAPASATRAVGSSIQTSNGT